MTPSYTYTTPVGFWTENRVLNVLLGYNFHLIIARSHNPEPHYLSLEGGGVIYIVKVNRFSIRNLRVRNGQSFSERKVREGCNLTGRIS